MDEHGDYEEWRRGFCDTNTRVDTVFMSCCCPCVVFGQLSSTVSFLPCLAAGALYAVLATLQYLAMRHAEREWSGSVEQVRPASRRGAVVAYRCAKRRPSRRVVQRRRRMWPPSALPHTQSVPWALIGWATIFIIGILARKDTVVLGFVAPSVCGSTRALRRRRRCPRCASYASA